MTQAKDKLKLKGSYNVKHYRDGELIDEQDVDNLVVNDGLAALSGLFLNDVSETEFDFVAIGSGSTAPSASDSSLVTEIDRQAATGTQETDSVTNDQAQLQSTFSFSGAQTIEEVGVFNDAITGTMFSRSTISTVNVTNGDSLQVTYQITFS